MHRPPKIAIVANLPVSYVKNSGASPEGYHCVWLTTLSQILQDTSQFEIHWVIPSKEIKQYQLFHFQNQKFHLIPKARTSIGLCTAYLYDYLSTRRIIKRIQPDMVHAWGTEDCHGVIVSRLKTKKVLSIQGVLKACAKRTRIALFERLQGWLYEELTLRRFRHITVESYWARDRVKEYAPDSVVHLWEYAISDDFYHTPRHLSDTPCCVLAGSDTPVKNVASAIRVFKRPELSHITLYLAGVLPGAYNDLPPNIIPMGFVPHDTIASLLSQAWALVHPSLADSCPNIVKEARVMGIPTVVTTECGAKQYIINGKSGFIIPPNDDDALATAVLVITKSKKTSLEMGKIDQDRCRIAISKDTMRAGLLSLYEEVLKH